MKKTVADLLKLLGESCKNDAFELRLKA